MKKSKKKLFIILGIVLAVVIVLGILGVKACSSIRNRVDDSSMGWAEAQVLEPQDLSTSISTSGTVASQEVMSVTSDLTYKIEELPVQLGDYVTKGQTLCVFDDTELQENIKELEAVISESQRLAAKEAEINQRAKDEALTTQKEALAEASANVNAAQAAYNQAKAAYESLGDEAYADFAAAESELTAAQNAYKQVERSTAAEVQAAQDAIDTQTISSTENETTKQLADLYRKAEKTTVVAEQDGIITSIHVNLGSIHAGGELMTIQNTSKLKVTVSLTENDILKVENSMPATITCNALEDEKITGTVSKVINFATTSASESYDYEGGMSSAGYSAEVIIDNPGKLLLGMSVNVKIITNKLEECLAVSYDSILYEEENEEKAYVLRANDNGNDTYTVEKVEVTVGTEGEYYTQISSDDLQEGDYILYYPDTYSDGDVITLDPSFLE